MDKNHSPKTKMLLLVFLMMPSLLFAYDEGIFDVSSEADSFFNIVIYENPTAIPRICESSRFQSSFFSQLADAHSLGTGFEEKNMMKKLYDDGDYLKVIQTKGANYQESYIRFLAMVKLERWQEGIEELDGVRMAGDSEIDSICAIGEAVCRYFIGDFEKALLLVSGFGDDYSTYLRSLIFSAKGEDDSLIKQLAALYSDRIEPYRTYLLINSYNRKKDYSNTLAMIERMESFYPYFDGMAEIKYLKGQILYKKGYFKRSIMALQDVILKSDSSSTLFGNAYYLIGKAYFMLGDYDKMEEYLYYVKLDASRSDFKKNAEFLDGKGFFLKGDYKKASEKLKDFSSRYPEDELTQYAYQLLSQSYFYMKNYKRTEYYMGLLKSPSFFADKLIMMKYFIDYRNGVYADSISAYRDFLSKEASNPMRREAYETIIRECSSDSMRVWAFDNLNREFPESENLYMHAVSLCRVISSSCSSDFIIRFITSLKNSRKEKFEQVFMLYLKTLSDEKRHKEVLDLYGKFSADLSSSKNGASYLTALSLKEMRNTDGALFMLVSLSSGGDEFADSSLIKRAEIYFETEDSDFLKKYVESKADSSNEYVAGELYRIYGEKLLSQKRYREARDAFLKSAELYGDNRNKAAKVLLKCSDASASIGEKNEAVIFAEKALLMATDIDVLNEIKLHIEGLR